MTTASDEKRLCEIIYTRAAFDYAQAKKKHDECRLALDRAIARRDAALAAVKAEQGEPVAGALPVHCEVDPPTVPWGEEFYE